MMKRAGDLLLDRQRGELELPEQVLGERLAPRVGRVDRRAVVAADRFAHAGVGIGVEIVLPVDVGELLGVGRLGRGAGTPRRA